MAKPNEISKQYEEFVLEFVNAKTSDEIFLKVLTNTAAIFNFSAQFKEDLKEIYPSRNDYLSLSKIEKQLFLLLIRRSEYFNEIGNYISIFSEHTIFKVSSFEYNETENGLLTLEETCFFDESEGFLSTIHPTVNVAKFIEQWEKAYDEYSQNAYNRGPELFFTTKNLGEILNKLVIIGKWMSTYKNSIAESRFEEIEKLTNSSRYVFLASKYMRRKQKALRAILEKIVNGKDLHEIALFGKLLEIYNRICRPKLEKTSNGYSPNKMQTLEEELFRAEGDVTFWELRDHPGKKINPYRIAIVFCAVEFLRTMDSRKLARCPVSGCERFFVGRVNQIYCSNVCKNSENRLSTEEMRVYQKERRNNLLKEKQKSPEMQEEKEIQRRMKSGGWTREEVIWQMNEDREFDM